MNGGERFRVQPEHKTATEELKPEEVKKIQQDLIDLFKEISSKNPDELAGTGVQSAHHHIEGDGQSRPITEVFTVYFEGNTEHTKQDTAELRVYRSSSMRANKTGKVDGTPIINVEFKRTTAKDHVFNGDGATQGEPGIKTTFLSFETDIPPGIVGRVKETVKEKVLRKPTMPKLKDASVLLTGTATIYADSNTPRFSSRTMESGEQVKSEVQKLATTIQQSKQ
jgi:hypothetical protein